MNTDKTSRILEDMKISVKVKLSALWVTLMLLYVYKDILSLFVPGAIEEIIAGFMGPFPATQAALLQATILMIIPAVMVFLSLTLKPNVNRWANIVLGVSYAAVNVFTLIGETWAYYLLFGAVEIVLSLLIIRTAWKWPKQEISAREG